VQESVREHREHRGFTLIELIIVVALVGVIVSIAIPGLVRARMTSRETAAITALRAVNNAQAGYASVCGNGAYAVLFPTLANGPRGSSTGFLSTDLTGSPAPEKSGYRYTLAAGADGRPGPDDCNGTPTNTAYYASAVPTTPGTTGRRGFATNQERGIWQDASGAAPTEPFAVSPGVSEIP
jgi:prepilin-type N-terminal cleavage/methylation domain-containing protein